MSYYLQRKQHKAKDRKNFWFTNQHFFKKMVLILKAIV